MKRSYLITVLIFTVCWVNAQNRIGLQAGFLGTHTSIAEYERVERHDFLLDSMSLSTNVGSFQAALNIDLDLGKRFFLSTGFHYSVKGLSEVVFTDSIGWPWTTAAKQHYAGLSAMLGYKIPWKHPKLGLHVATGFKLDIAFGAPNGGALFSGPYARFFAPFTRFSETDLSWMTEAGIWYSIGPGDIILRLSYQYGLSDVLEDAFVIGRPMSVGITVGYAVRL